MGRLLTWEQRISVAIGVAKGIQFLHTGIVPGVYDNNLRITDVLLDSNLAAKISSYNLPLLVEGLGKVSDVKSLNLVSFLNLLAECVLLFFLRWDKLYQEKELQGV